MSRTWVHTPYYAKPFQLRWSRFFQEEHDHRHGACDLGQYDPHNWLTTHCHIGWCYLGRNIGCGCTMCTGQFERRWERRQARQAGRRYCRDGWCKDY